MRLLIARHADTQKDMHDISMDGMVADALSAKGNKQAEALAKHLSSLRIDYIYSSDILRAVATAYVVSDVIPDVTLMLTKDLRIKSPEETESEFFARVGKFICGLESKAKQGAVLLIAHSDVISAILGCFGAGSGSQLAHAGISEFILENNGNFSSLCADGKCSASVVRINDTSHLRGIN